MYFIMRVNHVQLPIISYFKTKLNFIGQIYMINEKNNVVKDDIVRDMSRISESSSY